MTKRTVECPNYSVGEGACKCGCGLQMADGLVLALQGFIALLQRVYGGRVRHIITSGARCKTHNQAVAGSPTSQHLTSQAADGFFDFQGPGGKWIRIPSDEVGMLARNTGMFGGIGYIEYRTKGAFVHLDVRPGPARIW